MAIDPFAEFQADHYIRHNQRRLEHVATLGLPLAGWRAADGRPRNLRPPHAAIDYPITFPESCVSGLPCSLGMSPAVDAGFR